MINVPTNTKKQAPMIAQKVSSASMINPVAKAKKSQNPPRPPLGRPMRMNTMIHPINALFLAGSGRFGTENPQSQVSWVPDKQEPQWGHMGAGSMSWEGPRFILLIGDWLEIWAAWLSDCVKS